MEGYKCPENVLRCTRKPFSSQITAGESGRRADRPPPGLVCADIVQPLFGAETWG